MLQKEVGTNGTEDSLAITFEDGKFIEIGGKVTRRISIPAKLKDIETNFKDGMLKVSIPKLAKDVVIHLKE